MGIIANTLKHTKGTLEKIAGAIPMRGEIKQGVKEASEINKLYTKEEREVVSEALNRSNDELARARKGYEETKNSFDLNELKETEINKLYEDIKNTEGFNGNLSLEEFKKQAETKTYRDLAEQTGIINSVKVDETADDFIKAKNSKIEEMRKNKRVEIENRERDNFKGDDFSKHVDSLLEKETKDIDSIANEYVKENFRRSQNKYNDKNIMQDIDSKVNDMHKVHTQTLDEYSQGIKNAQDNVDLVNTYKDAMDYKKPILDGIKKAYTTDDGALNMKRVAVDSAFYATGLNAIGDGFDLVTGNRTLSTDKAGQEDIPFVPIF